MSDGSQQGIKPERALGTILGGDPEPDADEGMTRSEMKEGGRRMTGQRLIFLNTETTGLDSDRHEVWEVAYIVRDAERDDVEHCAQLPVSFLDCADPMALRISGFWERRLVADYFSGDAGPVVRFTNDRNASVAVGAWAMAFCRLLAGATIVGAVPDFDVRFLSAFLRRHGLPWTAHYHLCDVENLAVGFLAAQSVTRGAFYPEVRPPWDSDKLAGALGVKLGDDARHTALGDARWARDMYDAVMKP